MYTNDCYDTTIYEVADEAPGYRKSAVENTESSRHEYQNRPIPDTRSCCRKNLKIKFLGGSCLFCFSMVTATLVLHFLQRSQWIEGEREHIGFYQLP